MTPKHIMSIVCVFAALVMAGAAAAAVMQPQPEASEVFSETHYSKPAMTKTDADETRELGIQEKSGGFLLKTVNGVISVFDGRTDAEASPVLETQIDVSTLRAYDRETFEKGIVVETYEELVRILEDFSN